MPIKKILVRIKDWISSSFLKFALKKGAFYMAVFFVAPTILFLALNLMPSSPADMMANRVAIGSQTGPVAGERGEVGMRAGQQEMYMQLKEFYIEKFGLGEGLWDRFKSFWTRLLTLDFGVSYWKYPTKVSEIIKNRLPWTMALQLPLLPVGFFVGNWIGSRAGYYSKSKFDKVLYYLSLFLHRAPYFWLALILVLVFSTELGWFPAHGAYSLDFLGPKMSFDFLVDAIYHWLLPFLSLLSISIGGWAVGMRAMVIYEKESDYIEYSKQLGFSNEKLREFTRDNAILPNFSSIPLVLSNVVGGGLVVEIIFGYPGIGYAAYNAVFAYDYPLIEATFLMSFALVLIGNFFADLIYGKLDPRTGTGYLEET